MPIINNTTDDYQNKNNSVWKHAFKPKELQQIINNKNNVVIFMYKNVYNWIYSINQNPYNISFKQNDKQEILNNNVNLNTPYYNYNCTFGNIIQLYNFYYTTYMSFLNKHDNVIFLDYKKLIDITISYKYINAKLNAVNLSINDIDYFLKIMSVPSKIHGKCVKNATQAHLSYAKTNNCMKRDLVNKTKIHQYINSDIINYYENKDNVDIH